jgi:GDPmannose 4,6-dehydratase
VRSALITGVVGQDGAYLARRLMAAGYRVIGTQPEVAPPPGFIEAYLPGVDLRVVDLADQAGMTLLLAQERPDEIYNLASISSVAASWRAPVHVAHVNGVAFLGLLESVRSLREADGYDPSILQASSAEIFGAPVVLPQDESHPIRPSNPYGVAKAFAHFSAINARTAHGMRVSTVILFNHESQLRPSSFVTRKITSAAVRIAAGLQDRLELGNLEIRRDWGAAVDYTRAMARVGRLSEAGDFVLATGESRGLQDFARAAFNAAGIADPDRFVTTNPAFVRPTDIPELRGDPSRARSTLDWEPRISFEDMVASMVHVDRLRLTTGVEHNGDYLTMGLSDD